MALTSFSCGPDGTAALLPCTQRPRNYTKTEEPQVQQLLGLLSTFLGKHLTETRQDSRISRYLPSSKQPADSGNGRFSEVTFTCGFNVLDARSMNTGIGFSGQHGRQGHLNSYSPRLPLRSPSRGLGFGFLSRKEGKNRKTK